MLPTALIRHEIPGRSRLLIAAKRRDTEYFEAVRRELAGCEGVDAIETNHVTGSVLIMHRCGLNEVGDCALAHNLFTLSRELEHKRPLVESVSGGLQMFDRRLSISSQGALDMRSLVFVVLFTAAVTQAVRGNVMPAAVSLLWYALGLAWKRSI